MLAGKPRGKKEEKQRKGGTGEGRFIISREKEKVNQKPL
jgi:hypothetical protein